MESSMFLLSFEVDSSFTINAYVALNKAFRTSDRFSRVWKTIIFNF